MKPHEFKHNGKLLGLRVIDADKKSYGGFVNPTEVGSLVRPEKWSNDNECGNGIHFWPWGISRSGKDHTGNKIWQVIEVTGEVAGGSGDLEGKAKCSECKIVYSGNQAEADRLLIEGRMALAKSDSTNSGSCGSATNTGVYGSATNSGSCGSATNSGSYGSAANSGFRGSATNTGGYGSATNTGNFGSAANTGDCGSATNTGNFGSATNTGDCGSATNTGDCGLAVNIGYCSSVESTAKSSVAVSTGLDSKAKSGPYGTINLAWCNRKEGRVEIKCKEVGNGEDGLLKPHVWYRLDENGNFCEIGKE